MSNSSRRKTSNNMNYGEGILVIHRKRTSLSAKLGFDEEHQTNKALVNALLSGQPMKGSNHSLINNMSRLQNSWKPKVKKQKLQSTDRTEIISSSSQAMHNSKDEIPLILRNNGEIRKLAESAKDDCKENYGPVTSCETVQKLTKTLVLPLNSVVNSTTGFEIRGTGLLNADIAKIPYVRSIISADQVGISLDTKNSFAFDGVLFEEKIGGGLTNGEEVASNQPKVSPYRRI